MAQFGINPTNAVITGSKNLTFPNKDEEQNALHILLKQSLK